MRKKFVIVSMLVGLLCSCITVKEYEKYYLNDPDMVLENKEVDRFEIYFQSNREAAVGGNGGKASGGCGCN